MELYLLNKFELKSQNENVDRQVPSQVTYCKGKIMYYKNKPWLAACTLLSSDS